MLKRLRWMAMGLGLGAYAQRRFRQWARSYAAPEVARRSSRAAGRKATEVRTALAEGRQAMRQREAQLRQQLDPGR